MISMYHEPKSYSHWTRAHAVSHHNYSVFTPHLSTNGALHGTRRYPAANAHYANDLVQPKALSTLSDYLESIHNAERRAAIVRGSENTICTPPPSPPAAASRGDASPEGPGLVLLRPGWLGGTWGAVGSCGGARGRADLRIYGFEREAGQEGKGETRT